MTHAEITIKEAEICRDPEFRKAADYDILKLNLKFISGKGFGFLNATAWQEMALELKPLISKGTILSISGVLKYDSWTDKSGQKRNGYTLSINSFQINKKDPIKDNFSGSVIEASDDIPF